MVAKLRSDSKIAPSVGVSAAWPTSEEPTRMATPRAAQNGTFQRMSRRGMEDVIGRSQDSTGNMVTRGVATRTRGVLNQPELSQLDPPQLNHWLVIDFGVPQGSRTGFRA